MAGAETKPFVDRFGLTKLCPGDIAFHPCEPEKIYNERRRISSSSNYYFKTGRIPARAWTKKADGGITYGLGKRT